jgi:Reverse transcriptase (RNA-dependent DNA polymerase)
VAGKERRLLVGCYIPPGEEDGSTMNAVDAATMGADCPIDLYGDLNTNLEAPRSIREEAIAAEIACLGLTDISKHFGARKNWGRWTFSQQSNGNQRSRVDYIMSTDRKPFFSFRLKEPRLFNSDHRCLVVEQVLGRQKDETEYVKGRSRYPIEKKKENEMNKADRHLESLTLLVKKEKTQNNRVNSWIDEKTWELIDQKAAAKRKGSVELARKLGKAIRKALTKDRKDRVDRKAEEIQELLDDNQPAMAFAALKGWYKAISGKPSKPTISDSNTTTAEYEKLYQAEQPAGEQIPINVVPRGVRDDKPDKDEIWQALKRMRLGRATGATGISVEDLRKWREEDGEEWKMVTEIVEWSIEEGTFPAAFGNGTLVLLPKGDGSFRGIALLEIIYKLVSSIIAQRLTKGIDFHDSLHGFRQGRGTGTATIEAKLQMQLARTKGTPFYQIFLDLKKAYDTLDRGRMMAILEGYGVGPNIRRFISAIGATDTLVPRLAGFFGTPFKASRGVRQGDVVSPIIFNIVVDAVVREWEKYSLALDNDNQLEPTVTAKFYADDGLLASHDAERVQQGLDKFTELFLRVGLKMNATKTVVMISGGPKEYGRQGPEAYRRKVTGRGKTHRERMAEKVKCPICEKEMRRQSLQNHGRRCHGVETLSIPEPICAETAPTTTQVDCEQQYTVSIVKGRKKACPVKGCLAKAACGYQMRRHFVSKHAQDTITVLQEGPIPLPRCAACRMFSTTAATHPETSECKKWAKRAEKETKQEERTTATQTEFYVSGQIIQRVVEFKYLGRVLDAEDNDQKAVMYNLNKAKQQWGRLSRVLASVKGKPKTMAKFYMAIIQAVLLFGSETWALTKEMEGRLDAFHHRCARHLTQRHIRQKPDGTWDYPRSSEVLEEAGLKTIKEYIGSRKRNLMEFVSTREIYRQCTESKPLASDVNHKVWWTLN